MVARAFVTGSRVYGTPRENSDLDLIVLVNKEDIQLLYSMCDKDLTRVDPNYGEPSSYIFTFGSLNLICVTKIEDYQVWKKGTKQLKEQKPVTRDVAVALFRKLREEKREKETKT